MELDPIDDGEIHVPALRANNLAFREITYRQREPSAGEWFKVRHVQRGKVFEVSNTGPYTLDKGVLYIGKRGYSLKTPLAPGQKRRVSAGVEAEDVWSPTTSLNSVVTSKTLALSGKLIGIRPGPQIGKEVAARTDVRYVFVSQEAAQ
jgi:hypothetical protein